MSLTLRTPRLTLRSWRARDRAAFARLNADPEVAHDLGGPLTRAESDAKFERYLAIFARHGFSRLAIENSQRRFVGYAGIMPSRQNHPLGPHAEIGWRLARAAWGQGYATEAARAVLADAFGRLGVREVLAYTASDNLRSQAVMARLGLQRDERLDFSELNGEQAWHGLVWVARPVTELRQGVTQV
ncbi:MAG TPA: GNAT family N-acetyltransferase [Reyranella sp.]|nr:GNAT family N-acetyltransferase [Reyranella sp.]